MTNLSTVFVTDQDREYAADLLGDLGEEGITDQEIVAQWLCKVRVETLRAAAPAQEPFGYVHAKSGVNNGYYFLTPAEFAHVEDRFRHIYQPLYTSYRPAQESVDRESIINECIDIALKHDDCGVAFVVEKLRELALSGEQGGGK